MSILMRWIKVTAVACLLVMAVGRYALVADSDGQSPVRAVKVTMTREAHGLVLDQLRKFADGNGFSFKMDQTSPDPHHVLVQMRSEGMRVIGVNVSERGATDITYGIFLYWERDEAVPEQVFDDVVAQLRKMLSETDGVVAVRGDE